jgi:citrate synthase
VRRRIANNTVPATAFKAIRAPRRAGDREEDAPEKGLRVADKGFMNTSVIASAITFIDGEAGSEHTSFSDAL